ncbi:3-polyprenyl-4-hydroxybenzoate carboxy-lyase [Campylobacter concisus UNSWCD]|nr:3-polyprenyl-4-hydroxybenzoate carboxy-lyase [Campylobacter concisus UNSWCD]
MCQCENLFSLKLLAKFGVKFSLLSDDKLLAKFQSVSPNVKELRQFKKQSKTPICVVKFGA